MAKFRHLHFVPFAVAALVGPWSAANAGDFVEPDVRVIWEMHGDAGSYFGWAVAELEDIDGDGRREAVIGAPAHNPGTGNTGRTVVVSGASGVVLFDFIGPATSQLGYAIADAGDVNGDGKHDILAGAPGLEAGHAFVYSGADGSVLWDLVGEAAADNFGSAVARAGDVNGDGRSDLLIGAEEHGAPGPSSGRAYIYSGADGTRLRAFDAEREGDHFGSATAWLGDIDADGVDDQFVGARDAGTDRKGRAYAYSGATGASIAMPIDAGMRGGDLGWFFVATPGDVDGDGVPDLYVGDFSASARGPATGEAYVYSGQNHALLISMIGDSAGQGLGPGRGAGDVDGDELPDIVAGSYLSPDAAPGGGKLSFYSGATGELVRTVTSRRAGENLGFDAVTLGDVDGDGWDDTLASAASGDTVYVIAGQEPIPDCPDDDDSDTGLSSTGDDDDDNDDDDDDDDDDDKPGCQGCSTANHGAASWFAGFLFAGVTMAGPVRRRFFRRAR